MAFTVVYDANVLYPNTLRDLLIRIDPAGTGHRGCTQPARTLSAARDGLVESIAALRAG